MPEEFLFLWHNLAHERSACAQIFFMTVMEKTLFSCITSALATSSNISLPVQAVISAILLGSVPSMHLLLSIWHTYKHALHFIYQYIVYIYYMLLDTILYTIYYTQQAFRIWSPSLNILILITENQPLPALFDEYRLLEIEALPTVWRRR